MTSPTLLVALLQETGHLNPSFKMMRNLRARGHDVRYLASPQLAANIEAEGFRTVPLLPEMLEDAPSVERGRLALVKKRRAITQRFRDSAKRLLSAGPTAFGEPPQLALVDITQTHVALWARAQGIPLLLLNTSLPQTKDPGIPPLRSALPFASDVRGRVTTELAWQRFLAKRRASAAAADLLGMCPPYELARRMAPRFGVGAHELDSDTVYMPQLRGHPELVFCARELDFPRPERAGRHYVESLDLARNEPAFDFARLPADKPLVYCALGGQLYRASETPAFLKRVVGAFATRPELTLVLATGRHVRAEELAPCPANVIVVERAPQLGLLSRARLMITHGGLGSVKECVAHGVPMLVFPLDIDQPGNAARVVHHGLGLAGAVAETSEARLLAMVDQVLGEPSFVARCLAMQKALLALEQAEPGASLVEGFLAQPETLRALRTALQT
jgi:zeaxanthin glucosyltransferase